MIGACNFHHTGYCREKGGIVQVQAKCEYCGFVDWNDVKYDLSQWRRPCVKSPTFHVFMEARRRKLTGEPGKPDVVCVHRGEKTGEQRLCQQCGDVKRYEVVYQCELHGQCTVRATTDFRKDRVPSCLSCRDLKLSPVSPG